MTDTNVIGKIQKGRLAKLLAQKKKPDAEIIDELFLATLTRHPTEQETQWALEHIQDKKDRLSAMTDVAWALINTREFILNH